MPNPEKGCGGLNDIFAKHIFYLDPNRTFQPKDHWFKRFGIEPYPLRKKMIKRPIWNNIAAISGAHTLGSAKLKNSGYEGFWSDSKNQGIFNNDYYKSIVAKGWGPNLAVDGNKEKNQWKRIDSVDPSNPHKEFMLDTDMCMAYDNNRIHAKCMDDNDRSFATCRPLQSKLFTGTPAKATSGNCCAWIRHLALFKHKVLDPASDTDLFCGLPVKSLRQKAKEGSESWKDFRDPCCKGEESDTYGDCDSADWPKGPSFDLMLHFAAHE